MDHVLVGGDGYLYALDGDVAVTILKEARPNPVVYCCGVQDHYHPVWHTLLPDG